MKANYPYKGTNLTEDEQIEAIEKHFAGIMATLGLDLEDDSLQKTPHRVAKMFVKETLYGLREENMPRMMTMENKMWYDHMLVERNIKCHSMCEHHFQNIIWVAHIAYIPKKKVIWLSKLHRLTDFFSRKPQVQERLTQEIHEKLCEVLETEDVAVVIEAVHQCVMCRGIQDQHSDTVTSKLSGNFKQPEVRAEFFNLIKK